MVQQPSNSDRQHNARSSRKLLGRRSIRVVVAAHYFWGSGRGRPGGRPSLSEVARLFDIPKSTVGDWVDEFDAWDAEVIAAATRFELRLPPGAKFRTVDASPDQRLAESVRKLQAG